jgi:hypothetical protein
MYRPKSKTVTPGKAAAFEVSMGIARGTGLGLTLREIDNSNSQVARMAAKDNPLKLNPLQLRTLTLFQALASFPQASNPGPKDGEVTITRFPNAHGDHFHLGDVVVRAADATGMANQAVWSVLEKKGLAVSDYPRAITLTAAGLAYETGLVGSMFHKSGH